MNELIERNLQKNIASLGLSVRSYRCLKKLEISTISELISRSESELLRSKNFGVKSLNEINSKLASMGLGFNMTDLDRGQTEPSLTGQQITYLRTRVEAFDFSARSLKCFRKIGIRTISDLVQKSESELMVQKNFGKVCLEEIISILDRLNLKLGTRLSREDLDEIGLQQDKTFPFFEEMLFDLKIPDGIESKLAKLDFSMMPFSKEEKLVLKKLAVNSFLELINIHYERLASICNSSIKANKIVQTAFSSLKSILIDNQTECNSLDDWLVYVKDEITGDGNLKKAIKKKKHIDILKRRYFSREKVPLREVAKEFSISPEGVRRVSKSSINAIYKALKFPYSSFIDDFRTEFYEDKNLTSFDGDEQIIDSIEFKLFNLILSELDKEIIFDYKALVWRESSDELLNNIETFLGKKYEKGDELSKNQIDSLVIEFILKFNYTHYSQTPLSKLFIAYQFEEYRDNFFFKKIDKLKICERIIKYNFPNGIAIYKNKNELLKVLKETGYLPLLNISIDSLTNLIISSENMVLWDWGVYIHKAKIDIDDAVLEKIERWVKEKLKEGGSRISLYGAYCQFKNECEEVRIPNEHALYTCMKMRYGEKYSFLNAPYISPLKIKRKTEGVNVLENFVLKFDYGIKKGEIQKKLGLKEYQVVQRIGQSDKILHWGDCKVIHTDSISLEDSELLELNNWIANYINKYSHVSVAQVFENNIVLCKKSNIPNPRALYSVIYKYFGDLLFLPRYPIIVKRGHGIEDDGHFSFNDLINHYFSSKNDSVTEKELRNYFVKERGYRPQYCIDMITALCENIVKYARQSFISLKTIGWSEKKSQALEEIANSKFVRDCIIGKPFSLISELIEEKLPSLDGNGRIYWQTTLLTELLEQSDNVRILGSTKELYVIVPNKYRIETNEDLIEFVLKNDFGGAANKDTLIKKLQEFRIANKLHASNRYSKFTICNEEVFVNQDKC